MIEKAKRFFRRLLEVLGAIVLFALLLIASAGAAGLFSTVKEP